MLPVLAVLLAVVLLGGMLLAWWDTRTPASSGSAAATTPETPEAASTPVITAGTVDESGTGSLSQVRTLLGPNASAEIRTSLDGAERALASGDTAGATQALGALQRQILQARRDGTISAETMLASLAAIQEAADQAGLQLPFQADS
jgi:hypothetical protein